MTTKKNKVCYLYANNKKVPKINLSGQWLKKVGFEIGQNVSIKIENQKIIISHEPANQKI